MKAIVLVSLVLLTFNLNAQKMANPQEAVIGLFVATDQRDWEKVTAAFDTKVLLDYSSMSGSPAAELSPDQIVTAWKGILPGFESTHHQIGNFTTTVDGNKASVFCYGTATHYLPDTQGNVWTVVGSYNFELTKNDTNNWKVSTMKFNVKYQDGNTSLPEKAVNNLK